MPILEPEARFIRETREYFSNIKLWPASPRDIDVDGWLSNFSEGDDRLLATSLLDSYLLISTDQCVAMVASAFHTLSGEGRDPFSLDYKDYKSEWDEFRSSVIVTFPASKSDPAGSGHIFARAAREWVVDAELQILTPADAVQRIVSSGERPPVVFVDDFSGSGTQFCGTWVKKFMTDDGSEYNFTALDKLGVLGETFFIPAICTWKAKREILKFSGGRVRVKPAHVLPPRYSAREPGHTLVPSGDHQALVDLLRRYANQAGYTPSQVFGYKEGGLALSFEHLTPDNTLPIFNGGPNRPNAWRALRRK